METKLPLYRNALDCMRRLRQDGKPVLLLSNAPRRAVDVVPHLEGMGVTREYFDHLLTSGDLTRRAVEINAPPLPGRNYFHLGPQRDRGILAGIDARKVERIAEADFILCSGLYNDETETPEDYRDMLYEAHQLQLIMLCANPDLTVMRGPKVLPCAGLLAKAYAELGGTVHYFGKPHMVAYEGCLEVIGRPANRLLAVGDTLRTDILGANQAGIDCLLVTGGIHAEEWGLDPGGLPSDAQVRAASQLWGAVPTGIIAELAW